MDAVAVLLLALQGTAPAPPFRVDTDAGVDSTPRDTDASDRGIVDVNGGGLALADFDRDGDVDLVVATGTQRLWRNRGDGTFEAAGEAWAIEPRPEQAGCAVGDVDADGFPDLVLLRRGADRYLENASGRGFEERTAAVGLGTDGWSTSGLFADLDGDGHVDLFVARYLVPPDDPYPEDGPTWKGRRVMVGPEGLPALEDRVLLARGDGTFAPHRDRLAGAAPPAYGLGAQLLDVDGDGRVEVFVANDSMPNHVWAIGDDGALRDRALELGLSHDANGREQACMGIALGDVDGDGRADLGVTNFSGEANALYLSGGRAGGRYRDRAARAGTVGASLHELGWGTGFQDVDLDGDLEQWVLNGHVYPEADAPGTDTSYAQVDRLYERGEDGRFAARALHDGAPAVSRAGAQADLDGDGDLDLVALDVDGRVRVLRNVAERPAGARWLRVALRDERTANVDGLGACVRCTAGGATRTGWITTSAGFQAAQPAEAHFGLGAVEGPAAVEVHWPDGGTTTHEDVALDRAHVLVRRADEEDGG